MADQTFQLSIIVPEKVYFSQKVNSISIVTSEGQMTVLSKHTDIMANVEISHLKVVQNGHIFHYSIDGGTLNFYQKENKAVLCVTAIESLDEINIERANSSKERAEKILKDSNSSFLEQKKAEIRLKKALNRISLKEKANH